MTKYRFPKRSLCPFTLLAIHPVVRGFTLWRSHFQGHEISSKSQCIINTTCGVIHGYSCLCVTLCDKILHLKSRWHCSEGSHYETPQKSLTMTELSTVENLVSGAPLVYGSKVICSTYTDKYLHWQYGYR